MTVLKALATIFVFSLLFALAGATAGCVVGNMAPEYYRTVCRGGREPGFEPVSFGVGAGLIQGLAAGLVVAGLLCWRDICLGPAVDPVPVPANPGRNTRRILLLTGFLLLLGFFTCSGAAVGILGGELGAYYRRYLEDKELISPLLAADPAFAGLEVWGNMGGQAFLVGRVPTTEDRSRLLSILGQAVGQQRARDLLHGVGVVGK